MLAWSLFLGHCNYTSAKTCKTLARPSLGFSYRNFRNQSDGRGPVCRRDQLLDHGRLLHPAFDAMGCKALVERSARPSYLDQLLVQLQHLSLEVLSPTHLPQMRRERGRRSGVSRSRATPHVEVGAADKFLEVCNATHK